MNDRVANGSPWAHVVGVVERGAAYATALAEALRDAWRARRDWRTAAQERYLDDAVDAVDLERRQRAWDRDESNAYSLSGWR